MNCRERFEDVIDHRSYTRNLSSLKSKPEKNPDLNGIRTHDLCDTGAVQFVSMSKKQSFDQDTGLSPPTGTKEIPDFH